MKLHYRHNLTSALIVNLTTMRLVILLRDIIANVEIVERCGGISLIKKGE